MPDGNCCLTGKQILPGKQNKVMCRQEKQESIVLGYVPTENERKRILGTRS